MLINSTEIIPWLLHFKYFALFPLMVIGGPIVAVVSGSLVAAKVLNFFITYCIIVLADLTGDTIYYSIGRWGGLNFIKKWGHYIWLDVERINRLKENFKKHGPKVLIFGKLTQAVGSIILVAAGVAEMPYLKFIFYNFVATLPKIFFLLLVGFYFIAIYLKLHQYSNYAAVVFVLLLVGIILIYYFVRKTKINNRLS